MKKRQIFILLTALFCLSSLKSFAQDIPYGIVSFPSCVTESKYGKQEQDAFEHIKTQMTTLMNDIEKQLNEIATLFQDPEYVDSLSPEAEQEKKAQFQTLSEELNRYQNQYMQVMQQANMKLMQVMNNHVAKASEAIAKRKKIPMVMREEACFHYNPSFDITAEVIQEMDKNFEKDSQKTAKAEQAKK
ncbi:MAG: OmpH family outer membrane protein [Simkaniaceae bacterium]|jgi:outer membrane protein|nr:OmpH family outer membrane protein [Chlamydiia bacterium]